MGRTNMRCKHRLALFVQNDEYETVVFAVYPERVDGRAGSELRANIALAKAIIGGRMAKKDERKLVRR